MADPADSPAEEKATNGEDVASSISKPQIVSQVSVCLLVNLSVSSPTVFLIQVTSLRLFLTSSTLMSNDLFLNLILITKNSRLSSIS